MASCRGSDCRVLHYSTIMVPAFFFLLSSLSLAVCKETEQPISKNEDAATILYDNCDIETYYKNHIIKMTDGWNRNEIATLLLKTHRQVVPSDAVSEFLSGGSFVNTTTLSRQYAENTDTRNALADLDQGTAIVKENDNDVTINTVHMIFTKTDIPTSNGVATGWEPGYLWPMDDLKGSLSSIEAVENELDYRDEAIAAIHDLHNIRPRHPIVHYGQRTNNWFYDTCQECKLDKGEITVEQTNNAVDKRTNIGRSSNTRPQWDGVNFDGEEFLVGEDTTLEDDEGTDHLCVCTQEHALQPPKMARGEVARALLYMNLRYSTPLDEAHQQRLLNNSTLALPYLDLTLTDCHPLLQSDDDVTNQQITNTIGYFSRLVEWHLADPPNQREIDRNNAICQNYQGNRNPFVDFYEESWALLDFETIEREVCAGAVNGWDDDSYAASESTNDNVDEEEEVDATKGFGCGDLMPGDVSFFMVKPSMEMYGTIDLNQIEEWNRKSFGLVTLVDLEPGLAIYVVGVDDDMDETAVVEGDYEGGTLKLEVPEKGIPAGSFFGYGNRMYLGTQWEPIMEAGQSSNFSFSVHQLYLYCIESVTDEVEVQSGVKEEYKILAALSTTGKSFGNEGLPSYWEQFQASHIDIKLSEHFTDGIHYGLIVLPKDASDSEVSGGYRYDGPTYANHDPYAKALIDEAYWERINNLDDENILDSEEGIYYKSVENDKPNTGGTKGDVIEVKPRLDDGTIDSSSRNVLCSLTFCSMAFLACIFPCAIFL